MPAPIPLRQQGLTIVELLVAMTISLMTVIAAAYVFLAARESQRAIDRNSNSRETGAFAMQLLGREIMNAGFYPATALKPTDLATPINLNDTLQKIYDTYPPPQSKPDRKATDWEDLDNGWPPVAFQTGIFGCDGGVFDVQTSSCPPENADAADTVVINYFTNDTQAMGLSGVGGRLDCTGNDVAPPEAEGDPRNNERKKNEGGDPSATPPISHGAINVNKPPQLPVFVSNRFTLKNLNIAVDQQRTAVRTKSLVCSGNGKSPHGSAADSDTYQSITSGLEDLQFTYGLAYEENAVKLLKFYKAANINPPSRWQNVSAVRVCLLTRTLGGNTRIADKSGAVRKYRDCSDTEKEQPANGTVTRHLEVFGLRNQLKQSY
ncbi:pilus assembly protein PilW [Verminephrobacter aporrectodeae subsp. tuberculatae]|uniref:Pilus assembly protein PilW n=1 Tax=Verminephrobacter aporrectodeae subsp. tuberculatae TaxID=1110392 RepID=A0ABT3KT49_9BURK|nr:PilW family protein [Verminephrobacter aporrectodeae]MCW5321504.1 pilus assembly protein PilW [Verminephrobacter aporrectodeae subsp. tuberculatae]